jgi:hypothetical protein
MLKINKIENAWTHKIAHNWKIKKRRRKNQTGLEALVLLPSLLFLQWLILRLYDETILECLGVYGGGSDERVERRGRTGGSSMCPCGLSHMDKPRVRLMPPRSSASLLDSAASSSMLRRDLEIECFREELDGAFDNDHRVLFLRVMFMAFLIVPCCTNSQTNLSGVSRW